MGRSTGVWASRRAASSIWDGGNNRTFFATTGFTYEDREGGTLPGQCLQRLASGMSKLLGTLRREPFSVTATYTYVHARETVDAIERDVPLTPRHSAGIVGMWETEDVGRFGVEWYYTGRQSLEENPCRAVSEPYMILGLLAEKPFGRVRLFVNGENLTGVRQTRWDPLLRRTQAADGRWTVNAWAPLEGRNISGGLRIRF